MSFSLFKLDFFSFKLWFMLIRINFNHNGGETRGNSGGS
jgi:hypothetical protein